MAHLASHLAGGGAPRSLIDLRKEDEHVGTM